MPFKQCIMNYICVHSKLISYDKFISRECMFNTFFQNAEFESFKPSQRRNGINHFKRTKKMCSVDNEIQLLRVVGAIKSESLNPFRQKVSCFFIIYLLFGIFGRGSP